MPAARPPRSAAGRLDGRRSELEDDWAQMVRALEDRYYRRVTRYTTNPFLRAKLGPALAARGVAPHLYGSVDEAQAGLQAPDD